MPDIDFEFDVDGDGSGGVGTDVIDHGTRRPTPWSRLPHGVGKRLLVAVLVIAVAVVILVRRDHRAPVAASPSLPPKPALATSAPPGPAQLALAQVVVLAESADQLRDDLLSDRSVICPKAPPGGPAQSVTKVLHTYLPGFTVLDQAVTRGAKGTWCGLQVRARDALGATVVVTILAPPDASDVAFQISHGNDRTTVVDVGAITQGWSVQVGWLGQTGTRWPPERSSQPRGIKA